MANARNSRTTHPRKKARRERAAARFTVHAQREMQENDYRVRKITEADALGLDFTEARRIAPSYSRRVNQPA
jgi:hypothetical protein